MTVRRNPSPTAGSAILRRLAVSADGLAGICRKWKVAELAVYGSVLRDDFGLTATWTLW